MPPMLCYYLSRSDAPRLTLIV